MVEVEDEHAEARFVAAGIAGLVEEGFSGDEVAVFYRTNAQSRVLEDVLVRKGVGYQVIGGPRFYERAEIKDAIAYLQAIDNPYDAVSLQRIANRPRRGIGDSSLARLQTWADAQGRSLWEATEFAEEAGVGAAPLKAVQQIPDADAVAAVRRARASRRRARRAHARAKRLPRGARGRAHDRGAGQDSRTCRSSSGVAREYQENADEPSLSHFLQEISLYSDQDAIRGEESLVTLMTLHNAKGLEFRAVYLIGMEEGIFPHARSIEEQGIEEERRLCLRRHDPREGAADAHACLVAVALGLARLQHAVALPRRASASSMERERLRPASWSSYGAQRRRAARGRSLASRRETRSGTARSARAS